MGEELKPCPFCGSEDLHLFNGYDEDSNWVVVCRSCKGSGTFCVEKPRAVERWNTRSPADAAEVERLTKLEKAADGLLTALTEAVVYAPNVKQAADKLRTALQKE